MSVRWVFVLFLVFGSVVPLHAQQRSRAYVDVTLGANFLLKTGPFDGEYYFRWAPTLLLGLGTQPDTSRSFVAAFHIGMLNAVPSASDVCHYTPSGGCLQWYPFTGILAITAGGRPLTGPRRFLELTGGPAYIGGFERDGSFGAIFVGRAGRGPGHYLAAGLSLLGVVTTIDGHLVFTGGLGLSLRTW